MQWVDYYNSSISPRQARKFSPRCGFRGTSRCYSSYEVSHMVDVRLLTDRLWRLLPVAGVIVAGGLLLLLIPGARAATAMRRCSWAG